MDDLSAQEDHISVEALRRLAAADINVLDVRPLAEGWRYGQEQAPIAVSYEYRKTMPNGAKWAKAVSVIWEWGYNETYKRLVSIVEQVREELKKYPTLNS